LPPAPLPPPPPPAAAEAAGEDEEDALAPPSPLPLLPLLLDEEEDAGAEGLSLARLLPTTSAIVATRLAWPKARPKKEILKSESAAEPAITEPSPNVAAVS